MGAAVLAGLTVGWLSGGSPKAQGIRLLDMTVLGPLMIVASSLDRPDDSVRLALAAAGAATIAYNGRNYLAGLP